MNKIENKLPVQTRLSRDTKAQVESEGEKENRSISNMIEHLVTEALEARRAKRRRASKRVDETLHGTA